MSLIQTEAYDAFRAAGAPEPEARAAAMAAADIDVRHTVMAERLNGIDRKLTIIIWIMSTGFVAMIIGLITTITALQQVFLRLPRWPQTHLWLTETVL